MLTIERPNYSKLFQTLTSSFLLLAGLSTLVGCQGISTGSHSAQTLSSVLSLATSGLDFGGVPAGSSKTMTVTASNTGNAAITVSSAAISTQYFSLNAPSLPVTIAAGQAATISVTFSPNTVGSFNATLAVTSNASDSVSDLSLAGTGTAVAAGQLTLNPSAEAFGGVSVGSTQAQTVTLTNMGAANVDISQASVSGTGFKISGINAPLTLTPNQSTTFTATFAPLASGSASGLVTITSDGSNPALTMALSGTGISAGTLGSNPSSLSFGSVTVGSNQTLSETISNTGGSSITISQVAISGTGFSLSGIATPITLAAGQTASFNVGFTPTAAGAASGTVTISSNASNPTLTIGLSGTGVTPGALGSNPTSLSFGNVTVGNNSSLSENITNTGGSSVTISQVGVSGTGFTVSGISTPLVLSAGQSAGFTVSFRPTSAGTVTGNVTITSNATNPTLAIPLSGTGITPGTLGANPGSLSFGSVIVGNNQALSDTITNTGGTSVTISQVGISGTGFSLNGISAPLTLAAGQSANFTVTFTPSAAGSATGTVTITSNASNPTLAIAVAGTGVAPGTLGSNPTSLSFGSVTVGSNQSLSETVTNTGGSSVTISQVSISGSGFSLSGITAPVTLTAGQSATFNVKFSPTGSGNATGSVTITSNASNPTLAIALTGTGIVPGTLGSNPASLSFGNVTVGTNQSLSATVTNTGGTAVTISQVGISGTGFGLSGITAPATLTAGQSVTFIVTFTPTSAATASGSVTITSNASNPTLTVSLSGTGVAAPGTLSVSPTTLGLGSVVVGTSGTASGILSASGGSVTVTGASSNNSVFTIGGLPLPVTIPAGQSASFTVTFSPLTSGAANGTLTFTSIAQPATITAAMTGTGTPAPTYTVNLSWNASTSSNISGYNIYRAVYTTSCGPFAKINSLLNTSTLYTDPVVVDGTNYCYATTAVNTTNQESGYSNIVSDVQIPAP